MKSSYSNTKIVIDLTSNRCFFTLLSIGITLISMNMALNMYIMKTLRLNGNGFNFGNFSIFSNGIAVHGNAHIADHLQTNSIRNTNPSNPLHIISPDTLQLISSSKKNFIQIGKFTNKSIFKPF